MPYLGMGSDIDPVFSQLLYPDAFLEKLGSEIKEYEEFNGIQIELGGSSDSLHRVASFGYDECMYEDWDRERLLREGEELVCREFPSHLYLTAKVTDWSLYKLAIFHPVMEWNPIEGNESYMVRYAFKYRYYKISKKKVVVAAAPIRNDFFYKRSIVVCK